MKFKYFKSLIKIRSKLDHLVPFLNHSRTHLSIRLTHTHQALVRNENTPKTKGDHPKCSKINLKKFFMQISDLSQLIRHIGIGCNWIFIYKLIAHYHERAYIIIYGNIILQWTRWTWMRFNKVKYMGSI